MADTCEPLQVQNWASEAQSSSRFSHSACFISLPPRVFAQTGIGLAPEHMAEIFEPFTQVDASFGGNGLGLALAKRSPPPPPLPLPISLSISDHLSLLPSPHFPKSPNEDNTEAREITTLAMPRIQTSYRTDFFYATNNVWPFVNRF